MLLVLVVHCPFGRVKIDSYAACGFAWAHPPRPHLRDQGFVFDIQTFIDCPGTPRQCLVSLSSKVHVRHHRSTMLDDDKCLLGGSSGLRNTDLCRASAQLYETRFVGTGKHLPIFSPNVWRPMATGVCRRRPFDAE